MSHEQESMDLGGLTWIAQLLVIIGALNWGLIGFFNFDLVAALFGGQTAFLSRVVYALVGISGLIAISFLVGNRNRDTEQVR
jgi:uncharacterized membrane protein YuzA (DUF378 family)